MIRRVLAIAALLLTALVGLAPVAQAQYIPGQCGFTTQPSTVQPGDTVTFVGTGAIPGETLTFTVDGVTIATGTANPDGTFSISGTVPATLAPGQYTVTTTCGGVEISNILTVVSGTSGIIPGGAGTTGTAGTLPQTGSNSLLLFRVALALVAAGGLIILATKRRRAMA